MQPKDNTIIKYEKERERERERETGERKKRVADEIPGRERLQLVSDATDDW